MPRMGSPSMVRVPFSKLRIALTQLSFVLHANIFTTRSKYFACVPVYKAAVYPAGHAVLLLPRHVGALPRLGVVPRPVERHELVPQLLLVIIIIIVRTIIF